MSKFYEKEWTSELVRSYSSLYRQYTNDIDRLKFLAYLYTLYRKDHSFGEYDFCVIISDEIEVETEDIIQPTPSAGNPSGRYNTGY